MTNLEKLNEENKDTSLENLTDEQAMNEIQFSQKLTGGEMERSEYFNNLVNKIDINEIKEFIISEPNINLLDEKEELINEYGFTEEEIEEGETYLDELRANPDMLDKNIENQGIPPTPITWPLIVIYMLYLNDQNKKSKDTKKNENDSQNNEGKEKEGQNHSEKNGNK